MTLFLITATEGVSLLQPTSTPEEKKKGLKYHAIVQTTSYISAITGFTIIFCNKILQGKPHFESLHGQLGLFVFIYHLIQLVFGITIAFVPRLFGSVQKAKSLWRFHRVFGYILLVLAWTTAQLGVRAHYMEMYLYSPHLMWFHWMAVILVLGGVLSGTRFSKWRIQQ
ncbi:eukaryotic cytochrome b561-domain-containing protein [Thamnidium elegans]|nr:eukaryotic cytochrome b561-domain-containing protein [Thamnidium elegans]